MIDFIIWYLLYKNNEEIVEDICNKFRTDGMKWRGAYGILYDRCICWRLEGKFYRMIVRPVNCMAWSASSKEST